MLAPSGKTIGTHDGTFQADEAFGCWLLRQLPAYAGATVKRSRDPQELSQCEIVIDVGGSYVPDRLLFDHHQRGFFETADGEVGKASGPDTATGRWKTKLSASGLVYKHFGREIIASLAHTSEADTELAWAEIYDQFFESIDAIDNGIEISESAPRYKESSDLSSRVARLNPRWNEETSTEDRQVRFEQASALCGAEFLDVLGEIVMSWLPARAKVAESLEKCKDIHDSGAVIYLESGGLPWREHLYAIEKEQGIAGKVKFVLYPDQSVMTRVQAVTVEGTLFTNRLSLPESWCGLRDDALVEKSGILGCCFVHANGFIGGNKTYEGAIAMADATLRMTT